MVRAAWRIAASCSIRMVAGSMSATPIITTRRLGVSLPF